MYLRISLQQFCTRTQYIQYSCFHSKKNEKPAEFQFDSHEAPK